jgi:hypothetical protein
LLGALAGAIGGALFCALHGGTTYHRSIAYGWWVAAAACLVLMPVAGSKGIYRRTSLPLLEGWVFVAAAVVLSIAGAVLDTFAD